MRTGVFALPGVALLLSAACDFKETRSGVVALAGAEPIALIDESGRRGELVAGTAEVTFRSQEPHEIIVVTIQQDGRAPIQFSGPGSERYHSGNFVLRGNEINQPVDLSSRHAVTIADGRGRTEFRYTFERNRYCWIDVRYKPCDDSWTVDFLSAGTDTLLGSFTSVRRKECEVSRSLPYGCRSTL